MLAFHRAQREYAVTPLRHKVYTNSEQRIELLLKDERQRFGLPAFKVLGASYAVYRLLVQEGMPAGALTFEDMAKWVADRPIHLVTATDGNHGRAVAFLARKLAIPATVVVPEITAPERVAAIQNEGAHLVRAPGNYDHAVSIARDTARRNGGWLIQDTAWPGYQDIPEWITEGYLTMMWEFLDQLEGDVPDILMVQVGVGSLAAAVCWFVNRYLPGCKVVGVEAKDSACALASIKAGSMQTVNADQETSMAGLNCGSLSSLAWPILARGQYAVVSVTEDDAAWASEQLASWQLPTGASGAAGLAGLRVWLARTHRESLSKLRRVGLVLTESITDSTEFARDRGPRTE